MQLIDGPLVAIRLRIVSQRIIKKKAGKECYGLFNSVENCIYIAKDQTPEQALHTLMHELMHAADSQLELHEEEAKADIMATWLIRFFKLKTLEKVLS